MALKVNYYTLSIAGDGKPGNIKQSTGHVFTNSSIAIIQTVLDIHLAPKKQIGIITKIEDVGGICI